MKKTYFVFAAVAFLVSSIPARAQSPLAEAARREAARREAVTAAASIPTYTNEDLARLPARPVMTPARPSALEVTTIGVAGDTTAPAAGTEKSAGAADQPAGTAEGPKDEKYWRERVGAVRTSLSRAQMFADALQTRINSLSADFVNRDDPAQRQQIAEQRQQALDELARLQIEIADFLKDILAIQEEARRLGVPAGWVR